jgi:hypothetical protein
MNRQILQMEERGGGGRLLFVNLPRAGTCIGTRWTGKLHTNEIEGKGRRKAVHGAESGVLLPCVQRWTRTCPSSGWAA